MRKILKTVFALCLGSGVEAQEEKTKKFNVYLNIQSGFEVGNDEGETDAGFKMRQLRLEFKGNLNKNVFYRFRQRINSRFEIGTLDRLPKSTNMMYIGVRIKDKLVITVGKMAQAWGGFEFDYNPIYIYEYSDFVYNVDSFMVGGLFTYIPNKQHEFNLNITNSRSDKFKDIYGANIDIEKSAMPLTYILNWNGDMLGGKLQTRWAVGYQQEAKNHASRIITLGTKLNLSKFQVFVDYTRAEEDLDRLQYVKVLNNPDNTPQRDVVYHSLISKMEYQPSKDWNIFIQGGYETAQVNKPTKGVIDAGRRVFRYSTGVEYTPFKEQDLKLFLTYLGRNYDYKFNELDTSAHRVMLGMIYYLKAF